MRFAVWIGLLVFLFKPGMVAAQGSVLVKLSLSPAGQFEAKTDKIEGDVVYQSGKVLAQNVRVPLETLKTGIDLRDEHMKEKYLEVKKYPYAILVMGEGSNGQGKGEIEIRNIRKPISGTYKIQGKMIEAQFNLKLSDFGIKGIRYMGVGVKDEATVIVKMPVKASP